MFIWSQKMSRSLKNIKNIAVNVVDTSAVNTGLTRLSMEVENSITFGAEQLTEEEFNIVNGLSVAPVAEYYNTVSGTWVPMYQSKVNSVFLTDESRQTLEFEFNLDNSIVQL
jgi:hypothetical protein